MDEFLNDNALPVIELRNYMFSLHKWAVAIAYTCKAIQTKY